MKRSSEYEWSWGSFTYTYTYTYTWGYRDNSDNIQSIGSDETKDTGTALGFSIYTEKTTPASPAKTTIVFKGVKAGTTTVTIGNVKYVIAVTDEDLDSVTPLPVEYWITNKQVTADGATKKNILATAKGVYSATGAKFSDLVPATGTQGNNTDVFWKGTRLTSDNRQTADPVLIRRRLVRTLPTSAIGIRSGRSPQTESPGRTLTLMIRS